MTSSSEVMIELKQRDFQLATRRLATLPKNFPLASYVEIITLAFSALAEQSITVDNETVFDPFRRDTFFFERYAAKFSRLTFFHSGETAPHAQDVLDIFAYIYCYTFERTLKLGGETDFARKVLGAPYENAHHIVTAYKIRLELIRSEITAHSVVKQQSEVDDALYAKALDVKRQIEEFVNNKIQNVADVHRGLDERLDALSALIKDRTDAVETTATNTLLSIKTVSEAVEGWTKELPSWKKEVDDLVSKVDTKTSELNFVGLSEAFNHLIKKRQEEIKKQATWTKMIGISTLAVPALSLILKFFISIPSPLDWSALLYALPLVTIELMLLYFFRVALRNDYSLKAQLLQLEVRLAVCTFVQKYAEFAQKFKDKEGKMLEKFESLVFSGITADIQNIPSQFDGIEQLASLLKGARGES